MKKIGGFRKVVSLWFTVVMMALVLTPMGYVVDAATREDNVQKINNFLTSKTVVEKSIKKGISKEQIVEIKEQLNSLSDTQLEKLAKNINLQVGGELEDNAVSDFWKTWGLIIIIASALPILLLLIII